MIVEVRGVNTRNKGAELMLRAIAQELGGEHSLAVEPRTGTYAERARLGLHHKIAHPRVSDAWLARTARLVPSKLRAHARGEYGVVLEPDVHAVLDASGFAYSDQFDLERSLAAAERAERAKRAGQLFVLMPQALGPFETPSRAEAFRRIAASSDLIYARDRESLEHALAAGAASERVRLAPDFTCLLEGELPRDFVPPQRLALVVPSAKLLSETDAGTRARYLPFLAAAVSILRAQGLEVWLLQHERGDADVIAKLQEQIDGPAPTLSFESPLELKGVIGLAEIVVGSRFHALVSALSQGVPALAAGWSHKYAMLFEDYGCAEHVVDPGMDYDALESRLRSLTADFEPAAALLRVHAEQERAKARLMWAQIRALLGCPAPADAGELAEAERRSVSSSVTSSPSG